jgi:hypothetical protein
MKLRLCGGAVASSSVMFYGAFLMGGLQPRQCPLKALVK